MLVEIQPWGLPPVRPPRSRLASLRPIGLGTPLVESLPSYLLRLAAIHGLDPGVLVELTFPQAITSAAAAHYSRFVDLGGALMGTGSIAEAWSAVLADLTAQQGVRRTTLLPLKGMLGRTHLHREAAVCPACLAEMRAGEVYDPLAWSVAAVTVCVRHQIRLLTACPACGRPLRALGWRARVGHCRSCDAWLGDPVITDADDDDDDDSGELTYAMWAADRVGAMLAQDPAPPAAQRQAVVEAIRCAAIRAGSAKALASRLGLSQGLVSEWRSGKVRPGLPALLAICAIASLDPACLGTGRVVDAAGAPTPPRIGGERLAIDWGAIERALRAELETSSPRPLRTVLRELGIDPAWARRRLPDLCGALRARAAAITAIRTEARSREISASMALALAELRGSGINPSRRRIEALLASGLSVREPQVRDAWRRE